ncbi:MAG: hypothetical protein SXG53_26450 [Pseudomonadota bacterium]|nr:hypothetical protein [Pseudomonadota bacterium]
MARPSINDLPRASRRNRRVIAQSGLETVNQCREEDALRARQLNSDKVTSSSLIDGAEASDLAVRLKANSERRDVSRTLASKRHMLALRMLFVAALIQFLKTVVIRRTKSFTVVSKHWQVRPEQLLSQSAKRLLATFRSDLNRRGASGAKGWLICVLDIEYEPQRGIFVLHLHGLASGEMLGVLNRLRRMPKYRPVRTERDGLVPIYRPIVIKPLARTGFERQLTYLLKSHWTSTWRGLLQDDAKFRTARKSQRIPEPYHSLLLLWLDRYSLQDITLLMGLEACSFGFRRTRKSRRGKGQ